MNGPMPMSKAEQARNRAAYKEKRKTMGEARPTKVVSVAAYTSRVSVVLPDGTVKTYGINSREGRMLMLIADPYVRFNDTRYE